MKKLHKIISAALCGVMVASCMLPLASCKEESKRDSIVIMTEELSGLFNPFYATSGADMDVVGMTQIGMLSTDDQGLPVAGDEYSTVVKDFEYKTDTTTDKTTYTFIIKNGLKFSDGKPLTMNDILFNMYVYLDPVYTGSSTMYSIDIDGLFEYRYQRALAEDGTGDIGSEIASNASAMAELRKLELRLIYETFGKIPGSQASYSMTEDQMSSTIATYTPTSGYQKAVGTGKTTEEYRALLLEDYQLTLDTFKEELESDFKAAKESFDLTTDPYKDWADELSNDIFKFFLYEGYITPEYELVQGKKNRTKIVKFNGAEIVDTITTQEAAINKIYNDKVVSELNSVLTQWGTAGTLSTIYAAEATDILLHANVNPGEGLEYPNIRGIVSLGHTTNVAKVTVNGTSYTVAQEHNEDGTPKTAGEYDVLQITVNGTDPKAIYSFGFTVAPAHYYSADAEHVGGRTINIEQNQFGVEWSGSDFHSKTIQSQEHQRVPVGAGAFMATDENDNDNPQGTAFWSANVVYFKANENFMFDVKTKKLRMQVISSTNALDQLEAGAVDYITPQFTKANSERLKGMKDDGFVQLDAWQLGYGYIGINAGKVPDVNIRRAIMSAMQTSLALGYYETGTCTNIEWPMSLESWAYPFEVDGETQKLNGHDYTMWTTRADAVTKIKKYMAAAKNGAGVSAGDSALKIEFTVAGASITEHPTYAVFKQAAEILNELGWEVDVIADSQALTKLATGSLAVWAAAWGSSVDPDMYQVYHMNSTATSVYAWGYREIKSNQTTYSYEYNKIKELSAVIDEARMYMDQESRTPLYEKALGYVLDLAVEMPVYQRKTLYAYNSNRLGGLNNTVNPYSSPLEKIWELELKD